MTWPTKKLIEVCDFERGTEPGSKFYNTESLGTPFIRVGNIAAQIQKQIYTTSKNVKLCKKSDILIALDGSPGVVIRGIEGAYSSGIRKVVLRDPKNIFYDFIYYALQTGLVQNTIREYSTGVTIKHASKSLQHIEIPLPPLSVQKKIVYVLDSVQDAVRVQDKIIGKTKELKKAMMHKLFREGTRGAKLKRTKIGEIPENWEVVRLGEITEIKGGKRLPKGHKFSEVPTSYPYIRVVDFKNGSIDTTNIKHLSQDDYEILKKYYITKNDIYISIAGTIGLVGTVPEKLDKAVLTENAAKLVIKDKEKACAKFLALILTSGNSQNQIKGLTGKSTQPKLALFRIRQIKIPLPPLPEQQEIAEIFQTIDQKIELEKKKKELYEELFKTMLNKLMKREIKVNNLRV